MGVGRVSGGCKRAGGAGGRGCGGAVGDAWVHAAEGEVSWGDGAARLTGGIFWGCGERMKSAGLGGVRDSGRR